MQLNRRILLGVGAGAAGLLPLAGAEAAPRSRKSQGTSIKASDFGVSAGSGRDQTAALAAAAKAAVRAGLPLSLPAGRIVLGRVVLPAGIHLAGVRGQSTLAFAGRGAGLIVEGGNSFVAHDLNLDGAASTLEGPHEGLLSVRDVAAVELERVHLATGRANGLHLTRCGGRITACDVSGFGRAAIFSLDATGLLIDANTVSDCGNNGILVWRSAPGEDRTQVLSNRISKIRSDAGGSGQNGNGINVYRAGGAIAAHNTITDCAYSAVRGNSASDISIVANSCARIGEVALYAEFAFQGAVIAQNLVDTAATGIAVTNYNEGGRLAVVQGNLIRNLFRREHEPQDKRGVGIGVEADAAVTGNTIEGAPTAGMVVGWGRWMRDVAVSGNMIRDAGIGIAVTGDPAAGLALISGNLISGTRRGAIRTMQQATPFGGDLAERQPHEGRMSVHGNATK